MGKEKHLKKLLELFEKSPVVSFKTIEKRVGNRAYALLLIHHLVKSEKIFRLAKGHYTFHQESSLAVYCYQPAYLGLQSALSAHGMSEQETIPVILTASKARVGIHAVMNTNILVRRLGKKHFFGFETLQEGDFYLPFSDIEKTFIDMVVFRQPLNPELLRELKKKIDNKKLKDYLKSYAEQTRKKVKQLLTNELGDHKTKKT